MLFASESVPSKIVYPPALLASIKGVPVALKLVAVDVDQTVPVPVTTILPVPNATDRIAVPLDENTAVVRVLEFKLIAPVFSVTEVTASVGLPDNDNVMSDLLIVAAALVAVAATVTVAAVPEFVSKVTLSALVGGPLPPAPPVVSAQLVVDVLFHVPLPPTQKYDAIRYLTPRSEVYTGWTCTTPQFRQ